MDGNQDLYVIWSFKHSSWWNPYEAGYTESLADAGRYTARQAGTIVTRSYLCTSVAIHENVAKAYGSPTVTSLWEDLEEGND